MHRRESWQVCMCGMAAVTGITARHRQMALRTGKPGREQVAALRQAVGKTLVEQQKFLAAIDDRAERLKPSPPIEAYCTIIFGVTSLNVQPDHTARREPRFCLQQKARAAAAAAQRRHRKNQDDLRT